jgi:hypothetical protein
MKTTLVTAIAILGCILNATASWTAHQDSVAVQATAAYYQSQLTWTDSQIETANTEITELASMTDELKNKPEVANNTVAELRDKNYELRYTNYGLRVNDKLRDFESTDELKAFLEQSDVDQCVYLTSGQELTSYDCEDYAKALRNEAHTKGFHMNIQIVWHYRRPDTGEVITRRNEGHALNSTIIGNEMYFVEPSTDEYWLAAYLD